MSRNQIVCVIWNFDLNVFAIMSVYCMWVPLDFNEYHSHCHMYAKVPFPYTRKKPVYIFEKYIDEQMWSVIQEVIESTCSLNFS